jgi:hypothetical protein
MDVGNPEVIAIASHLTEVPVNGDFSKFAARRSFASPSYLNADFAGCTEDHSRFAGYPTGTTD